MCRKSQSIKLIEQPELIKKNLKHNLAVIKCKEKGKSMKVDRCQIMKIHDGAFMLIRES